MKKTTLIKQLLILLCVVQLATATSMPTNMLSSDEIPDLMKTISDVLRAEWKLAKEDPERQESIGSGRDALNSLKRLLQAQFMHQKKSDEQMEEMRQKVATTEQALREARTASNDVERAQAETQATREELHTTRRELENLKAINNTLRTQLIMMPTESTSSKP